MYKACSKCGKVHPFGYKCNKGIIYKKVDEDKLRWEYKWKLKTVEIRERANYLCEVCRDQGVWTYEDVEVHHIKKLREAPELYLDNDNLICLCKKHHKEADNNEIDMDYLTGLAIKRESRT